MQYQEMLTLLFALILFTSIAMIANNNLLNQADFLHDSFYQLQAIQIAQYYIDKIDEGLYSEAIKIDYISSLYDGENTYYYEKENMSYTITISSTFADSLGNDSNTITNYYRIDLRVNSEPEVIQPVHISRHYAAF